MELYERLKGGKLNEEGKREAKKLKNFTATDYFFLHNEALQKRRPLERDEREAKENIGKLRELGVRVEQHWNIFDSRDKWREVPASKEGDPAVILIIGLYMNTSDDETNARQYGDEASKFYTLGLKAIRASYPSSTIIFLQHTRYVSWLDEFYDSGPVLRIKVLNFKHLHAFPRISNMQYSGVEFGGELTALVFTPSLHSVMPYVTKRLGSECLNIYDLFRDVILSGLRSWLIVVWPRRLH